MRIQHFVAGLALLIASAGSASANDKQMISALAAEVDALRADVAEMRYLLGDHRSDVANQVEQAIASVMGGGYALGPDGEPVIPAGLLPFVPSEARPILLRQQSNGTYDSDQVGPFAAFSSFRNEPDLRAALAKMRGVDPSLVRAVALDDLFVIYVGPYKMQSEARAAARLFSRQVNQPFRLRDRSGRILP